MSYAWAKDNCSDAEMRRFAACFLNCSDMQSAVDWDAAAAQYDPKVKAASFKTVTLRAVKKAEAGAGTTPAASGSDAGEKKKATKGKAAGGKKRKAADEDDAVADSGEDEMPAKKAKGGKKGKKDKAEPEPEPEPEAVDEDVPVKGESEQE